jgi:hypothetical protein
MSVKEEYPSCPSPKSISLEHRSPSYLSLASSICSSISDVQEKEHLTVSLAELKERVEILEKETNPNGSLVHQACFRSLRTRMPIVLRKTQELIETASSESQLVSNIRTSLALVRAVQYMERLQQAYDEDSMINGQLQAVLDQLDIDNLPEEFREKDLAFRVSPWVPSLLAFDLPVGKSARSEIKEGGKSQLPIAVEVEPVVEFRAYDTSSIQNACAASRACNITIEKVAHEQRRFRSGAGWIGEAMIRVRVSPCDSCPNIRVWGCDKDVPSLWIKEARA